MKKSPRHTHNFTFTLRISHYLSMPYGSNLTNKFVVLYVYLYHTLTSHTQLPELTVQYSSRYARYHQSKRTIRTRANGDTLDTNSLRIIRTILRIIQYRTIRTKRTARNPEQTEKLPFRYTNSPNQPFFSAFFNNNEKWLTSLPEKQKWVVCFSIRVVYISRSASYVSQFGMVYC